MRGQSTTRVQLTRYAVSTAHEATDPASLSASRSPAATPTLKSGGFVGRTTELAAIEQGTPRAVELQRRGSLRRRDAAERELRRLGHRIRRRSGHAPSSAPGVASLTTRELEIARRIDRQTNREIAEQLFLSPRTVETHVRNILSKLGADSRVEVARIVEQADRAPA
jgi:DNA-binding NarL/FixJ family response regulator